MAPCTKAPRYAHSDGHTGICYSADGKNLITCGSEGDIRIWHGFEDDDPSEKCVGEKCFAVAQVGDKLYVGTDHNNVQAFSFPDAELDRICTRFTAPVTCISIVKDWLVAGSADMKVHAFNLTSGSEKVISCHNGPILEVSLDPELEFLATSCCDGLVRVFSMDTIVNSTSEEATPIHTWTDFIPKSNDFEMSPVSCRIAWGLNENRLLAIPHKGKVHLYKTDSWQKAYTLAFDESEFQVVRFSPCGLFLAAGGSAGDIVVWKLENRSVLYSAQDTQHRICSLEWNSGDSGELAYCDMEGQLILVERLLDPASPPFTNGHVNHHESILPQDEIGEAMLIDEEDGEDDQDDNVISLDKIKAQSGFVNDEEGGVILRASSPDASVGDTGRNTPESEIYHPVATIPATELQPPFQPTSTPTHFQYRFMVYNDVGMVRYTNTEEENSIDVEFHDSAIHHSFRINNVIGHTMAALSAKALVLACDKDEDKPSKLSCIVINSWDGSKEWSMEFPDDDIQCVASGDSFIACVCEKRLLRIFTIGGLQREIISLPGPVVCLNAKDNFIVAVYHCGQGVPEDQNLSYSVYSVGSLHKSLGPLPLPLSPRSTLRWIGFSEEGSLLSYDSECVLRLHERCSGNATLWRPVCFMDDLTKGKSDHYFIVGVTESSHSVRCILCKGCFYPATLPRPILTQVSWKLPVCEPDLEKSSLEETFWRKQLAMSNLSSYKVEEIANISKEVITAAVKLFALSCKTDNGLRAIELCELFTNPQFLQLAVRYATSTGRSNLAERIAELKTLPPSQPIRRSPSPGYQTNSDSNFVPGRNESQDFTFAENTLECTPPDSSNNIILAMKQKVVVKPQSNVKIGRLNPFKRNNSNVSSEKTDVIAEMIIKSQQKVAPPVENKPVPAKEKPLSKPQMKFTEWFAKEKENLESEFPELDKPALNKVAMKRFKELNVGGKLASGTPVTQTQNSVRNFFKKQTTDSQQSLDSQDSNNSQDTTMIPSSQEINNENNENSKKRKLDEKEDIIDAANAKKPLTAANKLQAFSFNK